MSSSSVTLEKPVLVLKSGYHHPYFAVRRHHQFSESDMLAKITTLPALGQWTVVPAAETTIHFAVLLETNIKAVEHWQVEIWWGSAGSQWSGLALQRTAKLGAGVVSTPFQQHHHWYSGSLVRPASNIQFTVRFRTSADAEWRWASDGTGVEDARLLLQTDAPYAEELAHYVDGLDGDHLTATRTSSDSPDTAVWLVNSTVPAAKGDISGRTTGRIGRVSRGQKWFALIRLSTPWLAPRHGNFMHALAPEEAILYAFLRDDGLHVVFLAVSGVDFVQTVFRGADGGLMFSAMNDGEEPGPVHIVASVGRSFDNAIAAAMYKARSIVSPYEHARSKSLENEKQSDDVKIRWATEWSDGFTYCTWNGLGKELTEEKLINAFESMKQSRFSVTNLIIDDNWQDLDREGKSNMVQGWKGFEANKKGFPEGLSHAVHGLRARNPELKHVAVWHALLGYWGGISPGGQLAQKYKTRTVHVRREANISEANMLVIDPEDVSIMYADFYKFLNNCTVDAAKSDAQFALDELTSATDRRELMSSYKTAWTTAYLREFTGRAISCMSQTPYMLFAAQLPSNSFTIPVRNSDDFFPEVEDSHPWHVLCNAYNSIFTKHLNVIPDWDMFQTKHAWASFHAAARCLSGGPICITDEPGQHDVDLIRQITAKTSRGQTVVLRPSVVGRASDPYAAYHDEVLLKIDAYNGWASSGCSFAGFFNCHRRSLARVVRPSEFLGVDQGTRYLFRAHRSGVVTKPFSLTDPLAVLGVEVDAHSWEILTAHPVQTIAYPVSQTYEIPVNVSVLGITSHMVGGVAILAASVSIPAILTPTREQAIAQARSEANAPPAARPRVHIATSLKVLGELRIWISSGESGNELDLGREKLLVLVQDKVLAEEYVYVEKCESARVLVVDVEKGFFRGGGQGGFGNEVVVDVYF